jgi:hypothetical protein
VSTKSDSSYVVTVSILSWGNNARNESVARALLAKAMERNVWRNGELVFFWQTPGEYLQSRELILTESQLHAFEACVSKICQAMKADSGEPTHLIDMQIITKKTVVV